VRDFTYGEVLFATFLPVLDFAKPKPGEVFYDLGCGSGLPLIIASMMYPDLKCCKGIELLEDLAALGL
jgi:16S rRNA G527 N7-methylase RsmG